jgi:hypothetical protein
VLDDFQFVQLAYVCKHHCLVSSCPCLHYITWFWISDYRKPDSVIAYMSYVVAIHAVCHVMSFSSAQFSSNVAPSLMANVMLTIQLSSCSCCLCGNAQIQEPVSRSDVVPPSRCVTMELTRQTLDTMIDGLRRIRDQLSSVAAK